MQDNNKLVLNEALKFGIIAGVINAVVQFGLWKTGPANYFKMYAVYKFIPIFTILFFVAAFQVRKKLVGYISFQEVLKFAFLSFVIFEVLAGVTNYTLFNIVDPTFQEKVGVEGIKISREFAIKMGGAEAGKEMDKNMAEQMKAAKSKFGFAQIALGIGLMLVWDFILSLLIAVIVKKERPAFLDTPE
jgi:hypothetical protein